MMKSGKGQAVSCILISFTTTGVYFVAHISKSKSKHFCSSIFSVISNDNNSSENLK